MQIRRLLPLTVGLILTATGLILRTRFHASARQSSLVLSANFQPRILSTSGEGTNPKLATNFPQYLDVIPRFFGAFI